MFNEKLVQGPYIFSGLFFYETPNCVHKNSFNIRVANRFAIRFSKRFAKR